MWGMQSVRVAGLGLGQDVFGHQVLGLGPGGVQEEIFSSHLAAKPAVVPPLLPAPGTGWECEHCAELQRKSSQGSGQCQLQLLPITGTLLSVGLLSGKTEVGMLRGCG